METDFKDLSKETIDKILEKLSESSQFENSWIPFTVAIALAVIFLNPAIWSRTRYLITIVHEVGHAIVGLFLGAGLKGIKIHSNSGGVTETYRKAGIWGWFSSKVMTYVGYPFPGIVALAIVALTNFGNATKVFFFVSLAFTVTLFFMRNIIGVGILALTVSSCWLIFFIAPSNLIHIVLASAAGIILMGGLISVIELHKNHYRGNTENSDVQSLSRGFTPVSTLIFISYYAIYIAILAFSLNLQIKDGIL